MDKNKNNGSILYLIPSVISEETHDRVITDQVKNIVMHLDYFIVENIRSARRFISSLQLDIAIEDLHFELLNKYTRPEEMKGIMSFIEEGRCAGIISEAGCPGIADPGAMAVHYAHQSGIRVVPLTGPSSILLALMASGFNGQRFAFHGYLPIDKQDRMKKIKELERESQKFDQTQIIMETPYRNQKLFVDLVRTLNPETRLCIAMDITGAHEKIQSKSVDQWKMTDIKMEKIPAVFLIYVP
jgi:16S rRNA (cytidine1402-2'-O)-methyltransferase